MSGPDTAVSEATAVAAARRHPWLVLLYLSLAGLSFAVLQSLVAPALPAIAKDVHASSSSISWVITAYLLSASVLTPILGRLGDMIGKRRVLLVTLVILAAGTVLAGLSTSLGLLIVARAIQGAAGAILPLSIGIVRDELPEEKVGVSVGMLSAIFGIGAGLGIVLAGPIVENLSWEWLFWFPLVLIVVALLGVTFGVPESPIRDNASSLDIKGTAILTVSLVAMLLAISKGASWGWISFSTLGLGAVGVIALVVFVRVELGVKAPLIDMHLLAIRGVWTTNVVGLTFGFVMFGTFVLIPTLLEMPAETGYGFGKSVSMAGLYLLPATFGMLVFGPISGILTRRFGARPPMVMGTLFAVVAFAIPAFSHRTLTEIVLCGVFMGAGMGLAFAAMSNAIIAAVPATHTGEAMSVNSIVRTVGGSIGSAVIAAALMANITDLGIPADKAFTVGFWLATGVAVIAVIAALLVPNARVDASELELELEVDPVSV
jgi:EmrB/QacA subfamily drug resistance transporter